MKYRDILAETERLIVRPVLVKDYDAFVSGYKNCGSSQNRFDEGGFDTGFMTLEWYQKLLERRENEADSDFSYMLNIFLIDNSTSIGYCDITTHQRGDFQYARIGYTIHNTYWGKGYATETVSALIKIGFDMLNFHRLEAHINLDNPASKKVIQNAGFIFESVRKGFILEEGIWTDNEVYYINNLNWSDADLTEAETDNTTGMQTACEEEAFSKFDIWYHGSPFDLTELAAGSTITQWRDLAKAFSHKPQMLSYDTIGGSINHNGELAGFLYVVDEPLVEEEDIYRHPRTTMDNGVEWLTKRPLKIRKISAAKKP